MRCLLYQTQSFEVRLSRRPKQRYGGQETCRWRHVKPHAKGRDCRSNCDARPAIKLLHHRESSARSLFCRRFKQMSVFRAVDSGSVTQLKCLDIFADRSFGPPLATHAVSQASVVSLAYGLTCYPGEPCGSNVSLANPAETLRDARVATALLQHTPLTLGDDSEAKLGLQVRKGSSIMKTSMHCGRQDICNQS